jgi:signal transduction histidine kinase
MHPSVAIEPEERFADLIHDLRQPLETIEYSKCYLEMLLGEISPAVQEQLNLIQRQLDVASRMLTEASARARAHA